MAAGTAAEFWLYSDLPCGTNNLRSASFTFFSVSSLIVGLALLVLRLKAFVRCTLPRWYAFVLMLYLPMDIALFIAGSIDISDFSAHFYCTRGYDL